MAIGLPSFRLHGIKFSVTSLWNFHPFEGDNILVFFSHDEISRYKMSKKIGIAKQRCTFSSIDVLSSKDARRFTYLVELYLLKL